MSDYTPGQIAGFDIKRANGDWFGRVAAKLSSTNACGPNIEEAMKIKKLMDDYASKILD